VGSPSLVESEAYGSEDLELMSEKLPTDKTSNLRHDSNTATSDIPIMWQRRMCDTIRVKQRSKRKISPVVDLQHIRPELNTFQPYRQ
jgi:hypothetical protein